MKFCAPPTILLSTALVLTACSTDVSGRTPFGGGTPYEGEDEDDGGSNNTDGNNNDGGGTGDGGSGSDPGQDSGDAGGGTTGGAGGETGGDDSNEPGDEVSGGDPSGGDPSGGDPDPSGGDPSGGDPSGGDPDPSGGDPSGGDPDPSGGDPSGGDPDPSGGGEPVDYGDCGWLPTQSWYGCGGSGEDASAPIACPASTNLVTGGVCGDIDGTGCCLPGGDNWFCTQDEGLQVDNCNGDPGGGGGDPGGGSGDPGGGGGDPGNSNIYIERANLALLDWEIGLEINNIVNSRNTSGQTYNPKNWITVAGTNCAAAGVPSNMQGSGCPLGGSTIGVCSTRFYSTGEIFDSTAIMLKSHQDGNSSEGLKKAVFTHEIGHCLGLKHTNSTAYIMYPSVGGTSTPHPNELAAAADAYAPVGTVSASNASNFFTQSGSTALRQFTFPVFAISGSIGSGDVAPIDSYLPPEGPPLKGDYQVLLHRLQADGTCIETIVPGGMEDDPVSWDGGTTTHAAWSPHAH